MFSGLPPTTSLAPIASEPTIELFNEGLSRTRRPSTSTTAMLAGGRMPPVLDRSIVSETGDGVGLSGEGEAGWLDGPIEAAAADALIDGDGWVAGCCVDSGAPVGGAATHAATSITMAAASPGVIVEPRDLARTAVQSFLLPTSPFRSNHPHSDPIRDASGSHL